MKLKRTLQILMLFCIAFLWMPMTAQAKEIKVSTKDQFIEAITKTAEAGDIVKLTASFGILADGSSTYEAIRGINIDGNGKTLTLQKQIGLTDSTIKNMTVDASVFGYFTTMGECTIEDVKFNFTWNPDVAEDKQSLRPLANGRITDKGELIPGTLTLIDVDFSGNRDAIQNNKDSILNYESGTINVDNIGIENNYTGEVNMKDVQINSKYKGVENYGQFNMLHEKSAIKSTQYGVYNNNGEFNMSNGIIESEAAGVTNNSNFNMSGGKIARVISGDDDFIDNSGVINQSVFNICGDSIIQDFKVGAKNENTGTIEMTGGKITDSAHAGVINDGNFTIKKGEIIEGKIGVINSKSFKMYGGVISDNTETGVKNLGNFAYNENANITGNGPTPGDDNNNIKTDSNATTDDKLSPNEEPVVPTPDSSNEVHEVVITDSEGNIVKEPERWVPTTPDEIKRYAFLGKEAVKYSCPETNAYGIKILNAMQGPKCFVSFEAALGDYTMGRTYNVYADNKLVYAMDKKATITLSIPMELQKEGRTFQMICVTEGGLPIVLNDLDKNPETITFETDKFYAFALIYK